MSFVANGQERNPLSSKSRSVTPGTSQYRQSGVHTSSFRTKSVESKNGSEQQLSMTTDVPSIKQEWAAAVDQDDHIFQSCSSGTLLRPHFPTTWSCTATAKAPSTISSRQTLPIQWRMTSQTTSEQNPQVVVCATNQTPRSQTPSDPGTPRCAFRTPSSKMQVAHKNTSMLKAGYPASACSHNVWLLGAAVKHDTIAWHTAPTLSRVSTTDDGDNGQDETGTQSSDDTPQARRLISLQEVQEALEEAVAQYQSCDVCNAAEVAEKLCALEHVIQEARAEGLPSEDKCLVAAEVLRRRLHNVKQDLLGAVRVFCRIRPMAVGRAGGPQWESDTPATTRTSPMSVKVQGSGEFVFDAAFDGSASQEEVFAECRSLVQSVVDGYPVTLLCFGQTGAGKTYTMYGDEKQSGIAFQAVSELFRLCDEQADRRKCRVYTSMVELYNNDLADLLKVAGDGSKFIKKSGTWGSPRAYPGNATPRNGSVTPRNSSVTSQSCTGARTPRNCTVTGTPRSNGPVSPRRSSVSGSENPFTEVECFSAEELSRLLWDGFAQRHVAATAMNGDSSRSHVVLLIRVHSCDLTTNEEQTGYMALVDLGGSERLKKSASTGEQLKEAIEINRSLTALGDVVEALACGFRGPQVPYRNHKLTLLLQDALGGSSKTVMIVNVAPSAAHCKETVTALRFGQRAGAILNTGQKRSSNKLLRRLSSEDVNGLGNRQVQQKGTAKKEQIEKDRELLSLQSNILKELGDPSMSQSSLRSTCKGTQIPQLSLPPERLFSSPLPRWSEAAAEVEAQLERLIAAEQQEQKLRSSKPPEKLEKELKLKSEELAEIRTDRDKCENQRRLAEHRLQKLQTQYHDLQRDRARLARELGMVQQNAAKDDEAIAGLLDRVSDFLDSRWKEIYSPRD